MKILKENPDTVYFGDKILRSRDSDVYSFGYNKNKYFESMSLVKISNKIKKC